MAQDSWQDNSAGQKENSDLSTILKSDLFSNLLPGEKNTVLERTGNLLLRKGSILFSPGKKAEHLYLLQQGLIRVLKANQEGEEEEIARFTAGDIIGDFDFARDAEYDAKAEAIEDSKLILFPGFGLTLDTFARETPHIASKILINAAVMVTGRIKSARKLIIESISWVQELHRKIYEDPGTGLWKQSFLVDEINRVIEEPMTLIMLKPDRFKLLVDSQGHDAGDKAMVKIAGVLKNITRKLEKGWALRFRSNETGILINNCEAAQAESLALSLHKDLAELPPFPMKPEEKEFIFSGSIAWGVWPGDDKNWDSFFEGMYRLLMDTWSNGGNKVVHYKKDKIS